MTDQVPQTVVETDTFADAAKGVFSEVEKMEMIDHLARTPDEGELIPGGGGVRYFRWAAKGHGKSRGARVFYLWLGLELPIYLLACYFKGKKQVFTAADTSGFKRVADAIKAAIEAKAKKRTARK